MNFKTLQVISSGKPEAWLSSFYINLLELLLASLTSLSDFPGDIKFLVSWETELNIWYWPTMETQPRTTYHLSPMHKVDTKIPQPMSLTHCPQTFSKSRGRKWDWERGGWAGDQTWWTMEVQEAGKSCCCSDLTPPLTEVLMADIISGLNLSFCVFSGKDWEKER